MFITSDGVKLTAPSFAQAPSHSSTHITHGPTIHSAVWLREFVHTIGADKEVCL